GQAESDQFHTERLVRLGGSCWCYDPYGEWPEISDPPALKSGHVTFGCLNKIIKVSRPCAQLWAHILRQVPGSRLALVAQNADCAASVFERLKGYGLPVDRLDIWPKTATRTEYLERFNRIDVGLDPFPFNGITTTCEGLWMGVPVVSMAGATSVSRAGRSILHAAGLGELATEISEQFIRLASELAHDVVRIRELRRMMRERLIASDLPSQRRFAARLERAIEDMLRAGETVAC
ncbi:MAG TPA: hypothetical protein VN541_18930, partial [Tepidisphaeraceae bacterium]|nr:hypothetical protein [Tepidisphaeraceae bacterium]